MVKEDIMTRSEKLFESFCEERGLQFRRIPEGKSKSADYCLAVGDTPLIVEVKQIDANKEETQVLRKPFEEWDQDDIYHWGIPGDRVRRKIADAMPQLRVLSKGRVCTLLVVYDNVKLWPELTDEYAIRVAMYGIETALISREAAPEGGATIIRRWYGGKRRVTPRHNTTLSAIGVMADEGREIFMSVYHNWHAKNRLPMEWLTLPGVQQFELEREPTASFSEWKMIS